MLKRHLEANSFVSVTKEFDGRQHLTQKTHVDMQAWKLDLILNSQSHNSLFPYSTLILIDQKINYVLLLFNGYFI